MDFELVNEVPSSEALANGPTFEDLAIDDSLSDLERVTKYVCSNIALQRVIHVKMLQETARSVGFQTTCERLIPLLEPLVCDVEYVVRQHVAFQFPPLCRFLVDAGGDPGYSALLNKMIPLVTKLVSDDQHEVRSAASESLVDMAALVRAEDQGQHILTIVLPLAHDDDNEQFRIAAVSLYSGLAEHFGPELCQQFCVPELISLSEDPVFRVRKSTAQSFSNVCKTAGQELSRERLLPAFQRLATDDIWGVRKACAECLVSMSEALAPEARGPLLIPMFEAFVADSSRWVRMAAYQSLGPFMASLDTDQVSEELVEHFVSMATTAAAQLGGSGEVDIKFHCAFNFPAVVSILGASQWPTLSSTFETLYNDSFWKIRRSFAYSLHELARMLGQGITETQLATAFDSYLHDVQDVRLGAMLHFADFLEHVSPSFRESYLPVLTELDSFEQTTKWRFREVLSRQLAQLCRIFTPEATFSVVYPLVFKLVTDPVAIVRQESYHACPLLMSRLGGNPQWLTTVVEKFEGLATSAHYIDRQVYLKICGSFLVSEEESTEKDQAEKTSTAAQHREMFATHLSSTFFKLAKDPVLNVCLVFAEIALPHRDFLRACDSCPEAIREQLAKDPAVSIEELATLLCEPIVKANETENAASSEEQAPPPPSEPDAGTAPPPAPTAEIAEAAEVALTESTEQLSLEEAPSATSDSNSTPTEAVDDAPDASSSTPDSDCASSKSSPPRPDAETPSDPPPGVAVDLAA